MGGEGLGWNGMREEEERRSSGSEEEDSAPFLERRESRLKIRHTPMKEYADSDGPQEQVKQ